MSVATAASVDGQQTASESGIDLAGRTVYVPGAGLSVLGRVTNDQVQTVFGTHDVAAVVLLPKPGEWIEDDDGSGPGMRGCWLGGLANADGSLTVLLAARGLVHEIVVDPARVDARRVVRDEGTQQAGLLEALTAEAQLHAETKREHAQWRDRLTADLHEQADLRDYCSDFDDFMEEHGLARRARDYALRVVIYLTRAGTSLDEAVDSVTREDVRDHLAESGVFDVQADD